MLTIVFLTILGIIAALGLIVGGIVMRNGIAAIIGGVAAALGIVIMLTGITTIDAKNVGVVTKFGKPVDTMTAGLNYAAPWKNVTTFDCTMQTKTLNSNKEDNTNARVKVRLADGGTAWLSVVLQWQCDADDKEGIKKLFGTFRKPENVDENFVEYNLRAAIYDQFASYDPLRGLGLDGSDKPGEQPSDLVARAFDNAKDGTPTGLKQRLERGTGGVKVMTLTTTGIQYDKQTEDRIDSRRGLLTDKANAITQKEIETFRSGARNEAAAGAKDPGTLYLECLNRMDNWMKEGKNPGPSFNCGAPPQTVLPIK